MASGPGKYAAECELVMKRTGARWVAVIVIDGVKGSGCSVASKLPASDLRTSDMLADVARQIRADALEAIAREAQTRREAGEEN